MKNLGELIYTNSWSYGVYAVTSREISAQRVSIDIYTVSPDGEMSDIITIPRKDIFGKKDWCNIFRDMDGDFGRDDIDKIKMEIMKLVNNNSGMMIMQNRATMSELHCVISDFIRGNAEELTDDSKPKMFVKNNFGYMATSCMDEFVKENKELGYKRLEILKRLKIMGALQPAINRPYDTLISLFGEKLRYYKIELAEIKETVEKAEEVTA